MPTELFSPLMTAREARLKTPLALAYVGDTVWDLLVRRSLLRSGGWKRTVKAFFFAPRTGTPRQDILRLPPKYRVVMYLRYYEDFTTGEIARLLKIPQSTAAARLSRGRGLLERQLRKGAA